MAFFVVVFGIINNIKKVIYNNSEVLYGLFVVIFGNKLARDVDIYPVY